MIVACGLSRPRTKRPFANERAFSSSSAGTDSRAILPQLGDDRLDRLVDPAQVDARLRAERAGVGVALVAGEDVVREPTPLPYLREQARRHAAAEDRREELQDVPVRVTVREAPRADHDVRLVGLLRVDQDRAPVVR